MRKTTLLGRLLGEKIQRLRKQKGMSGAQLARAAGLSETGMRAIERGVYHPSVFSVQDIATALGTTVNRLLA